MRHSRLKIQTSSNKYSIYIGTSISDKIKTILNNEKIFFNKVLIIYDSKIKFKEVLKIKLKLRKKIIKKCISFWLDWKDETIIKRIFKNDKRPLARHLSKIDLKDMINKRYKHYKQASHRIFCENLSKKEIADKIIKIYET